MSARSRPLKRLLPAALALAAVLLAAGGDAAAQTPGAPTIDSVTPADGALEVAWTAPTNAGGSSIVAYDLRYIETSADETVDSNWKVEDNAWTSGTLEYKLEGLDGGFSYDVQVRAVNGGGDGDWSSTYTGVPLVGLPSIFSVLTAETTLTVSWNGPPHAGPGVVTSYDLRYIETSADETVDSNWTLKTRVWTSGLLLHVLTGLTSGTSYDVQVRVGTTSAGAWSALASGTPREHGETLATATTIPLDAARSGEIQPGTDVDYFKFTLTRSTGILIFTRGALDTVGELLDRNGTLIAENDDGYLSLGIRNFLVWHSLPSGTYYVKVTSHNEATGSYVLVTRPIADSTGRGNAQAMALGDHRNGLIDPSGETDWFTFTLVEQTDVVLRGSSQVDGELQDSSGQVVSGIVSFDLPSAGFAYLATLAPGKYYIEVTPWSQWSIGLYSVYVLEATEPGSTLATALPLRLSRIAAGTIDPNDDTDYFLIQLDETTHVRLSARGEEVRVHGELLDDSGNTVSDAVLHPVFTGPVGFQLLDELAAGTHYIKVTGSLNPGTGPDTGPYAVLMFEDVLYADFVDRCALVTTTLSDALSGCQWHLINSGQRKGTEDEDINVEDAWAITRGSGINVAVVDDGMHYEHRDLRDNVNTSLNHDYTGESEIFRPFETHGTAVAGLIAARDNSIGVRGVAPRAMIYGYNVLLDDTDFNEADAMSRNMATTAVSNNSWGPGDSPLPGRTSDLWERAVDAGVTDGFGDKGVVYVWAAGNGADDGDYGTLDEYANYYGVIAACAVNDQGKRTEYSEMGANLWVCAPSRDGDRASITTTANFHRYTGGFGGTSAAAPQVSGVAALVRSVDTSLSWRDVKLILAASARKNDQDNAGWETGALKYGSDTSDPERYEFNHEYGFGVVDAKEAVDLAGSWNKVPPMRKTGPVVSSGGVTVSIGGSWASRTISVDSDIDFTEFVQVDAMFDAPDFRDLQVELVAPSGAVSVLSVPEPDRCPYRRYFFLNPVNCELVGSFRFGSARHLGEDPSGRWTLRMRDRLTGGPSNRLDSWSITVYGHRSTPDAPTLNSVDPGDGSLIVSWTEPAMTGTSAVTGYEVRHIRSDASALSKAGDSAWTLVDVAGSAGTSQYTHTLTGLDNSVKRDVQVRAVNASGSGAWSVTARGTPGASNSEPFFPEGQKTSRTVLESAAAGVAIGAPVAARDADSDTFTYSLSGTDAALFDIDSSTGQLRVKDPLDHETKPSLEVTVSVTDSKDDNDDPDTATDATIDVEVVVDDADEPPKLMGDTAIPYSENGQDEVHAFSAVDPEGATVDFTLTGADADEFDLDPVTGKLEFKDSPDYENARDSDGHNDYEVRVEASAGAHSEDLDVTVTVVDVNEAIKVECDDPGDVAENSTRHVARCDANDPEDGRIVWELSGSDRGDFEIDAGVLRFKLLPDFERRADSNGDNVFRVTVRGFDGANRDSTDVTATVTDVDEPGTLSLSSAQPLVGTALTADLDDPDGENSVSWVWGDLPRSGRLDGHWWRHFGPVHPVGR